MGFKFLIILAIALVSLAAAACGGGDPVPSPTSGPTVALQPTATATATTVPPTPTSAPTATDIPTLAPTATQTPTATVTPKPTATPEPTATLEPSPTPVATEPELFLQLVNPESSEVITEEPSIEVVGRTRVDAVVTVNDTVVDPDGEGRFSSIVDLEEGPNVIELVSSIATGDQLDLVLVVIYLP